MSAEVSSTGVPLAAAAVPSAVPGQEITQLSLRMNAVASHLEGRSEEQLAMLREATGRLQAAAAATELAARQFPAHLLAVIEGEAGGAVGKAVGAGLKQCQAALAEATSAASAAAREWDAQAFALRRQQRRLLWCALIALLLGGLLASAGSAYVAWHSLQSVRQARFASDLLRASEDGRLARCDGRLCARVGVAPRRFSRDNDYLLLEP